MGINTWAGHAPGIVFNAGLDANAASNYRKRFGFDVKFVLLEDPAAKLAAFRNGDVDVMWNTVDNWAREASILAEQNQKAKSIIMQDWSRGGDGIVSLAAHQVDRGPEGPEDRLHAVHAVALPAALPPGAVGAVGRRIARRVEKNIIFTQDAPAAAAMFKAKQVDAAVTWEPDLSAAVTARGDEAHVLVSTTAATNIIADTLCARQDIIDRAPETLRDFVHGWFEGIEMMKADPAASYAVVGKALKLDNETVSGMLSGLKLTPFADNAQFYGLTGGKAALRDAVRHGVRDLAQEGPRHAAGRREGLGRHAVHHRAGPGVPGPGDPGADDRQPGRPPRRTAPSSTSRSRSTSRRARTRSWRGRTSCSTPSARR